MTLKHILLGVALLVQCLALHALTEEHIQRKTFRSD